METELKDTISPCLKGHCGFVEIVRTEKDCTTTVYWCRYCGKLEVYEKSSYGVTSRTVNLTPKTLQTIKGLLDG